MKRHTQNILFHVLPVVFWLLAIGGIAVWEIFNLQSSIFNYIPAVAALISALLIYRIPRHTSAIEQCFQVGVLIGIAAWWLPTVLFLILLIWGYLIYQNLFNVRTFLSTLLGLALVAVWMGVLVLVLPETFHLSPFTSHLSNWIPTGAVLVAFIASTTARQILRVR